MKIGTMVHLGDNVVAKIREVKKYGMESFQLCCWNFSLFTDEMAQAIRAAADEEGLEISAVWSYHTWYRARLLQRAET